MAENKTYGLESKKYIMTRLQETKDCGSVIEASVMGYPNQFIKFYPQEDSRYEFTFGRPVIAFYEGMNLIGIRLDNNRPRWRKSSSPKSL